MKKKHLCKRISIALLITLMLLTTVSLAACGGSSSGDAEKFTWWIGVGDESSYLTDYNNHTAVKYIESLKWGEEEKTVDYEFIVPVAGAQEDNFNTLLATGEYPDIMDMSYYRGSVLSLYEDEVIMDITSYVEQYMPNYMAYLDANPNLKLTATTLVNGEPTYLQLHAYDRVPVAWGGFMYRRDWIVKYGTNPKDGSAFTGGFTATLEDGSVDENSWEDNVVFPNGGPDPIYISDWEWMLEIFDRAIKDLDISDGYPMTMFTSGFQETGDLLCAFGGGGGGWYRNGDEIIYGPETDDFRVYLECMNTWYKNGWIDKHFEEHGSDMFYAIDDAKVRQGKVGLFYGMVSQRANVMDLGDEYTSGICAFPARQPINDIYGSTAQQNVEPFTFFSSGGYDMKSITISTAAKDKDLETLFRSIDYMYGDEGAMILTYGLNKEQVDTLEDNNIYTQLGLTNGAYQTFDTPEGLRYLGYPQAIGDADIETALRPLRMNGLSIMDTQYTEESPMYSKFLYEDWVAYSNTGWLPASFTSQLTAEESAAYSKTQTQIREFLERNVPGFITGTKDPFNDADWTAFQNALYKYNPQGNTDIYQNLLDRLYQG